MGMTPGEKKAWNKGFEEGANSVEEGLPGWFGTFADMMTLLFAFFVLLAAISTMDPVKLQEMANSEGKSLGSKIKKDGAAEEEGEFEPIENLAQMKKEMKEAIEEMKKENPAGDPPIDIETSSEYGFPNIREANEEVLAISIKIGDDFKVYGCGEYVPSDGVMYVKCDNETQLLEYFIRDWSADYPDIVTGWNSRFFDIPYLMNRIIRILGEKSAQKMSPWGWYKTIEVTLVGN